MRPRRSAWPGISRSTCGTRSWTGTSKRIAGQGFCGVGLATGFHCHPVAYAAHERAQLLRFADASAVHQAEYPVEGFVANVLDGVVVSKLVAQSGFERGRKRGYQKRARVRIALFQSGYEAGVKVHGDPFPAARRQPRGEPWRCSEIGATCPRHGPCALRSERVARNAAAGAHDTLHPYA